MAQRWVPSYLMLQNDRYAHATSTRPAADPFAGVRDRVPQAAGDVPNNYQGGISARAEADAADLGVLGASNVSEWPCLTWLLDLSWRAVQVLVGSRSLGRRVNIQGHFVNVLRW